MSAADNDCTSLNQGGIRFYDNYVPTLGLGDYLINVTQQVNPKNSGIDDCYSASQPFSIQGPRYSLPPEDIFSVFPPNNSQGIFDQFLPHVVLTKRDLPWERNVFNDEDTSKQTPWMALLLFVDGETIDGAPSLLDPQVDGWTANRVKVANIPASDFYNHAAGDGILWPALEAEWYESSDYLNQTICSIIDISPQAFATLVPAKADLIYLAHARKVDPSAKDSDVLKVSGDGWYSVLIGSRLADPPAGPGQPGRLNIVHLVSLEGLEQYIDGQQPLPDGTTRVRMISFANSSFTCLPELGESFAELMGGLLKDSQGKEKSTTFALSADPPIDDAEESNYAYKAIRNGYVPLSYQTRAGEQTFAWYRGPFSPAPVKNFVSSAQQGADDPAGWQPFGSASSAIVYDKSYGLCDISYGVAWEAGRLMALSNDYFEQELMDWQRKGHYLIDLILERKNQVAALKNFDPDNPDPQVEQDLLDQIQPYAVTDDFMTYLITQFSSQIAPKLYDQPPQPPYPPFPAYPDMPSPPLNPQTIADLLKETDVQEAVRKVGGQELETIADYLAQLYLLVGVPFENLVPHAGLLPQEAVRFFYVDSNWSDALLEGALSIGIESSRDRLYQDLMKDLIWNTTFAALGQVRDSLFSGSGGRASAGSGELFDNGSMTGLLLRSAVVSGWPGLEVHAYSRTLPDSPAPDISSEIKLLRMDRLSSDVLLCMWASVPAVVTIDEPHEGVAFGFEDAPSGPDGPEPDSGGGYYLYLRSLDADSYGMPLPQNQYAIDAEEGIIDQNRLIKISAEGGLLQSIKGMLPGTPDINIRDFAVQMIKVPEQALFASPPAPGG